MTGPNPELEPGGSKYTEAAWWSAARQYMAAEQAKTAARERLHQAQLAADKALIELRQQEAAPGVPAWQHLKIAPTTAECRIEYCNIHPLDEPPF